MPEEPSIKLLSYQKRQQFFWVLLTIFIIALPVMIFYTTGHRFDFNNPEQRIVTTGGMYVTTDNLEVDVYLDDEQVQRPRLFRSAYYIQNIEAGSHRIVVQQDGLNTWVKELPVDPYIVIEAAAFNMPVQTHVRLIPQYRDVSGGAVFFASSTITEVLGIATTSDVYSIATSTATSSYIENAEYAFVKSLFGTSTATTSSVFDKIKAEVEKFSFATGTPEIATSTLEDITFIEKGNIRLVEQNGELFATWLGSMNSVPYYFCVSNNGTSSLSLAERYGEHVARQVEESRISTTTPLFIDSNRVCRQQIQIDRKRQDIFFYDFVPGTSDLVLLKLGDGLYVTEIDDRAWQNTQRIYAGTDYEVLVNSDSIYLKKGNVYFELLTEITTL